jgi:hypothetical protein
VKVAEHEDLEGAVESAIDSGLDGSSQAEVEELLGALLQRRVLELAGGPEPVPDWAASTFGPASLAKRFVEFHRMAIAARICDPEGGGLKPEFATRLEPGASKATTLSALSAAVMSSLHVDPAQTAGAAVAVYVALWLLHADLQHWCAQCTGGD